MASDGKITKTLAYAGSNYIMAGLFRVVLGVLVSGIGGGVGFLITRIDDMHTAFIELATQFKTMDVTVANNVLQIHNLNDRVIRLETRDADRSAIR